MHNLFLRLIVLLLLAGPKLPCGVPLRTCPSFSAQNNGEAFMFFIGAPLVCCLGLMVYKYRFDLLRSPQLVHNAFMVRGLPHFFAADVCLIHC